MFRKRKDGEPLPHTASPRPVLDDDTLPGRIPPRREGAGDRAPLPSPMSAPLETPRRAPLPAAPRPGAASAAAPSVASGEGRKLIVGRDIHLKGEVTSCDSLVIEGSAELTHTDARHVQVAASGVFLGTVNVEEADIAGRFEGELTARERLIVRSGGHVSGQIRYASIVIESGGNISGEVAQMPSAEAVPPAAPKPAAVTPEPEPEAAPPETPPSTAIERAAIPMPAQRSRPTGG